MNSGNTVIPQPDKNKYINCDKRVETELLMFSTETWLPERSKIDKDLRGKDKTAFKSILAMVVFMWDRVSCWSDLRCQKIPTSSGPRVLR